MKRIGGGRIAAHEIMLATPAIRNLIREDKVAQMYSAIQTGQNVGMHTLDQYLEGLVSQGYRCPPGSGQKSCRPQTVYVEIAGSVQSGTDQVLDLEVQK